MGTSPDRGDGESPLKRALRALEDMRARVAALEDRHREPVAILGMACRFPGGANTPARFWRNLRLGVDAITEVPADRFDVARHYDPRPGTPGKSVTRRGGFVDCLLDFDPVTGLAPKDADVRDPQLALLDLVCWEALEDAGIAPLSLEGTSTGVFAGIWGIDYWHRLASRPPAALGAGVLVGNTHSMAAGHVSYMLGLRGPSLAVDTACSASLVTVDLACQSLRTGASDLALAGGVNVILGPENFVWLSAGGFLAPDGRCKTFDASADGYGRGEGCGIVVLKRLSDALRDGDPIRAVIVGSAVNQDGRTAGMTVPNGPAQQDVVRRALAQARLSPREVHYVEAHGTGTPLGDPIEVIALGSSYGEGRSPEDALLIGSVKTNVGHLESAAGIAALIKVVLSLENEEIPPSLHFETPNPEIPWDRLPVRVAASLAAWRRGDRPRHAGVSSFGASGTNAHLLVREAPVVPRRRPTHPERPRHILTLSTRDGDGLVRAAARLADHLVLHPGQPVGDVCHTANLGRSHFRERLAVSAASTDDLREKLASFGMGRRQGVVAGRVRGFDAPRIAFAFAGHGSQYPGMGGRLYETQPAFRRAFDRCDDVLAPLLGSPLLPLMHSSPDGDSPLHVTGFAQPALFSLEYALAEMWKSWGVEPACVLGHSVGEYVAACQAGVFSLEDGLKLVAERGRLMGELPRNGRMVAVAAEEARVAATIAPFAPLVSIAALDGPKRVVISGRASEVDAVARDLESQGIATSPLSVSHAFHSPLMDPMRAEFERVVRGIRLHEPRIPIVSNLTGAEASAELTMPEYWVSHASRPVRFAEGVAAVDAKGCALILEVGPDATLCGLASDCLPGGATTFLPSLQPGRDDWECVLSSLGEMYVGGVAVDWRAFDEGYGRSRVSLPTYPFHGKRRLVDAPPAGEPAWVAPPSVAAAGDGYGKVVGDYYDTLRKLTPQLEASALEERTEDYLTFGPFPEIVPGFSWILALVRGERHPDWARLVLDSQRTLRDALFRKVDFQRVGKVLDFGCGYGSDLCTLALRHPHVEATGYTLSPEQAKVGRKKVERLGLAERVRIYTRDSSRDEFPETYDLAFGFEVAHHVPDKGALFAHLARHLREGGRLALADFVSRTGFAIEDASISSTFPTPVEWAEVLADSQFVVTGCVDISREISYFFHDPAFDDHLAELEAEAGPSPALRALKSYDRLGKLHAQGVARYVLLDAEKRSDLGREERRRINLRAIEEPTPFAEVSLAHGLYEVAWEERERTPPDSAAAHGRWLVLADGEGVGEAVARRVQDAGGRAVIATHGRAYGRLSADRFILDPLRRADFARLLADTRPHGGFQGVVHLWSLDASPSSGLDLDSLEAAQELGSASVMHLVQALAEAPGFEKPRVHIVTAQAHPRGDCEIQVAQAPVLGLGKALQAEHPELWGGMVDLDSGPVEDRAAQVCAELRTPDGECHVAYRGGTRLVARLVRRPRPESGRPGVRPDATYLVTGGVGGLGLRAARWLVNEGARHLVLTSRRGPDESAREQIRGLESRGARVLALAADVRSESDMTLALEHITSSMPPLRGVVHAAGSMGSSSIVDQTWERGREVLDAKVLGSWNLHRLTRDLPLDFFVCFSSAASLLASPGQSIYAAGNAFEDALGHFRVRAGLAGLTVNWGMWGEVGMAMTLPEAYRNSILRDRGLGEIRPDEALVLLGDLIAEGRAESGVFPVHWEKFVRTACRGKVPPYLERVAPQVVAPRPIQEEQGILLRVSQTPPAERLALFVDYLRRQVAGVLGYEQPSAVDVEVTLLELGFDSLMAIQLRNQVRAHLGVDLPIGRVLDSAAVVSLAALLQEGLAPSRAGNDEVVEVI